MSVQSSTLCYQESGNSKSILATLALIRPPAGNICMIEITSMPDRPCHT
jgi:hypothetical protein